MKYLMAVLVLSLSACTTYNGYPALIPLPSGDGPGVVAPGNGVTITPITIQSGGRATSFNVISPARGK